MRDRRREAARAPRARRWAKMSVMSDDPWKARLEALGALLREERRAAGLSQRDLAERTNVSDAYLSQVERGRHEPSLRVLTAVASTLGVPLETLLARAGIIEAGDGEHEARLPTTEAAIIGDPALTEPQRFALLTVYRSFGLAGRP
jgi:transcriptional regulator with XRE-family HTH domain